MKSDVTVRSMTLTLWSVALVASLLPGLAVAIAIKLQLPAVGAAPLALRLNPRVQLLLDQLARTRQQTSEGSDAADCLVTDAWHHGGAKCDNTTDDTLALQAAIDNCASGATVSLPAGKTCLTHTIFLRNGTQLRIPGNAVLKAVPEPLKWDNKSLWLVEINNARGMQIFGGGTIDGSGNEWWKVPNGKRPHLFHNEQLHNFTIRDVRLTNSGPSRASFACKSST